MTRTRRASLFSRGALGARVLIAGAVLALSARGAIAQVSNCEPGDVEVRSLNFTGNHTFSDAVLRAAVATTPSAWPRRYHLWFGVRRCLDHAEFVRDDYRLRVFYHNHGFPRVQVDTVVQEAGTGAVAITFRIVEGRAITIDTLTVGGLDSVSVRGRVLHALPVRVGGRFDLYALNAATDSVQERLHNNGYPNATVLQSWSSDTAAGLARIEITVAPGRLTRLGDVIVTSKPRHRGQEPAIPTPVVRALSGLHKGNVYSEQDLVNAQRTLYTTDAFRHVEISLDSMRDTALGIVPVRIHVDEGYMHQARAGAGWGTLDCFRTQAQVTDRHFLGGRARLDLSGRLSKIGVGRPLDIAPHLCARALRDDRFSSKLNYYGSATVNAPVLFGLRTVPTITLYSERRSEAEAYVRTTPVGAIASFQTVRATRLPSTIAYQLEYGRTDAEPAIFCALFNICDPASRKAAQDTKRLAILSYRVTRNRTDSPDAPTKGSVLQLEARAASRYIGSDPTLEFQKLLGDASGYLRLGRDAVLALRMRGGGVFTRFDTSFTPPQERLYAGGPNTVRGFRQNELGPVLYIASQAPKLDTITDPITGGMDSVWHDVSTSGVKRKVPTGGNTVAVGNIELRVRSPFLPELLQFTFFDDVGQVWNRGEGKLNLDFSAFRWTPGVGVRIFSPVGALRMDVGYNRYGTLAGPLYYEQVPAEGSGVPCTSPGNTIPVHDVNGVLVQETRRNGCIASFKPSETKSFLNHLTFNFSIGQAF